MIVICKVEGIDIQAFAQKWAEESGGYYNLPCGYQTKILDTQAIPANVVNGEYAGIPAYACGCEYTDLPLEEWKKYGDGEEIFQMAHWFTSGGNFTGLYETASGIYMILDGRRHGVRLDAGCQDEYQVIKADNLISWKYFETWSDDSISPLAKGLNLSYPLENKYGIKEMATE
jgi:hypothetical protein